MLENLLLGFEYVIIPFNFLCIVIGSLLGIIVGAMPGMHASTVIILLTPLTIYFNSVPAFLLSVAIYCGELFGGSITAILFRTPGTSVAMVTAFDGYEMTKKGKAGEALGVAIYSSAIGGLLSVLAMITIIPFLSKVAIGFGPAEFCALAIMGLSLISCLCQSSHIKGLIMALTGILFATVGLDHITGVERLTFNLPSLRLGINIVIVLLGILPLGEVFKVIIDQIGNKNQKKNVIKNLPKVKIPSFLNIKNLLLKYKITLLKSSIIGILIGILPGAGGTLATFLSYGEAVRSSKHPEEFGTGTPEGVLAAEAANNASSGGSMIPLLTLGIPGSETTAILLSLLVLHGIKPGPMLLFEAPELVYSSFIGMTISNILIIFMGIGLSGLFLNLLKVHKSYTYSLIFVFCIIAAFNLRNSWTDVWMLFIFGFFGYFLQKYKWPIGPLVLGLVLGNLLEDSFRRALLIYNGDFLIFFKLPISAIMLFIAIGSFLLPIIKLAINKFSKQS